MARSEPVMIMDVLVSARPSVGLGRNKEMKVLPWI